MHEISKLANSRYRWSSTETKPAHIMLPCAVWHTVAARHRTKTIKISMESSTRSTDDAHNEPHPSPTARMRSGSRRDVDVRPTTVPGRNLDIFRYRTSIWVLFFFVCVFPRPCGGAWRSFIEKSNFQYFMHLESISVTRVFIFKNPQHLTSLQSFNFLKIAYNTFTKI